MLLSRRLLLRRHAAGSVQAARGRRPQAPQLTDGLAHGTRVVGQALDVLEGQVDDLVAAGAAVKVAAGEALEAGAVGNAALAVQEIRTQRQRSGQGAAVQAAGLAGAQLSRRPEGAEARGEEGLKFHQSNIKG